MKMMEYEVMVYIPPRRPLKEGQEEYQNNGSREGGGAERRGGEETRHLDQRKERPDYYSSIFLLTQHIETATPHCTGPPCTPGRFIIESMPISTLAILGTGSMYGLEDWLCVWPSCPYPAVELLTLLE